LINEKFISLDEFLFLCSNATNRSDLVNKENLVEKMQINSLDTDINRFNYAINKVTPSFNTIKLKKLNPHHIFSEFNPEKIIANEMNNNCDIKYLLMTGASAIKSSEELKNIK
jgi:hypothetical protein